MSSTSKRYDDAHRGPGVPDAIQLSELYMRLISDGRPWPEPNGIRERMRSVLSGVYPAEQLDAAISEMARREAVTDALIGAIKAGLLPVWVAPTDRPDCPVPPSSFLELGRESIIAGCYRPPNDRGWLYGRPLFVKNADVTHFLARALPSGNGQIGVAQWTLHEAVAWIAAQDENLVGWVSDQIRQLGAEGKDGYLLGWAKLAGKLHARSGPADESFFSGVDLIRSQLQAACEQGRVRAYGQLAPSLPYEPIPPIEFGNAEMWHGRGLSLVRETGGMGVCIWHELRFESEDVRKLSADAPTPPEPIGPVTKIVAGTKLGRRRGTDYARFDAPFVEEMKQLLDSGAALSVSAAAQIVAPRAVGGGSVDSKARRLRDRYRDTEKKGEK